MTTQEKLVSDMKAAMKAKDSLRKDTLRMLLSELKYAQVAAKTIVKEAQVLKIISSYQKKLLKSVKEYPVGEQQEKLFKEIEIVASYLPKKASAEEIVKAVRGVLLETSDRQFGVLMKQTLSKLGPHVDGRAVSDCIKEELKKEE